MRIGVITIFPEMFEALSCGGVTARALEKGLVQLYVWNLRDFADNPHGQIDDRPYGGGPGMVMQVRPLRTAITKLRPSLGEKVRVIYLSPQGRRLDQAGIHTLLGYQNLLLIAGRYEGLDERLLERDIQEEWSIGDYVLSGGELAAMVMIDALVRWLPGALGDADSVIQDSFNQGLLDCPHYTRPEEIDGQAVPAVLLSGNHAHIAKWRQQQALGQTWRKRPELLEKLQLTAEQQTFLQQFINEHPKGEST